MKTLSQSQREFLIEWLGSIERNKSTRTSYNLKHIIEGMFFYISGEELHEIMQEVGIEGTRWTHNLSTKHIDTFLVERAWRNDFFIKQTLPPQTYKKVKQQNMELWGEYYYAIREWTRYPDAVKEGGLQ